jgi:hypothetical protein
MITVISPPNTLQSIDEVYLFVSSDEDGEGVCAGPLLGPGSMVPLIAADKARLDSLIPVARQLAKASGTKIKLVKFTTRTEVMEIDPQ